MIQVQIVSRSNLSMAHCHSGVIWLPLPRFISFVCFILPMGYTLNTKLAAVIMLLAENSKTNTIILAT